jgi:hypothetical protein
MPDVYKSPAVEALDDFFSGESGDLRDTYRRVLELLESDEGLVDITRRFVDPDGLLSERDLAHFRDHWLANDDTIGRAMKERYREAIYRALDEDSPVPIDTFWVRDAADDFEMHVLKGKRRIAVHVFIPRWFDPLDGK